jgi:glycosyltransferase involved in cell wall biosynthesis
MKNIFAVMPVANEEATIEQDIRKILDLRLDGLQVAIVMDNFSRDRTAEIVKRLSRADGRVHYVFHERSNGVVSCYLYGFKYALEHGADYIIEMDSGGSHSPLDIPRFISYLNQGYDCVFGSRFASDGRIVNVPFYRKFISWGGTLLANLFLGTNLTDMTSGFEAFNRRVLEKFNFERFLSRGHIYQTEMKFYCRKFKCIEIPIVYKGSGSSFKFKSVREAFAVLFLLIKERLLRRGGHLK